LPRNKLPRVMKHYSPTGRRNHCRHLMTLLDTWDRNESTCGPTPWQIYDDDDDNDEVTCPELRAIKGVISTMCHILLRRDCTFYTRGDVVSTQESTVSLLWESHMETMLHDVISVRRIN